MQILTPVTYAVGDEEFVEESIVQDETPEDVEEVSDDVDDETDDADLDEEEDEDSLSEEDDSFSGDVVDEESLEMSWDVISDAESESWDVVVIDSESWAVAATGSEVVVESGVDVSWTSGAAWTAESSVTVDDEFIKKLSKQWSVAKIAEELGINRYTESSKWAIAAWIEWKYLWTKEQNNVIREYFIQHAREILCAQESNEVVNEEVVEESEVVELNKEEISWRKYYNGVTAIVLAPINTFPEGTTLSIVPIKAKKDLNEIKEQLVEQQDEVTEESNVVAFDISFLYSWEEVQPLSWQTVQVTFNYGNHEILSEANEDEEQELKVYHLNDKDGSGNKVEDISEVKVEEVEIVKNEEWELVVDAESFSVYTIVTQVAEWPKVLEDQLANFEYGMISIARPDSLSGKYSDTLWFTIMDRNLWAEKTWVYTDLTTGSYWYHYQWWNNYWFISYTGLTDEYKTGNKIDVSWKNEYSWNQFVWWSSNNTWMSWSNNDNLWTWDNKQWPCPEWWHVPTAKEWSQLLEFYVYENNPNNTGSLKDSDGYNWISNVVDVASWFAHYFQIPFAGRRNYRDAEVEDQGSKVYLWSSTPNNGSARSLTLDSSNVYADTTSFRAHGFSVRCFKNTYSWTWDTFTVTYDFNGWSWSTASINVLSWEKAIEPSEPIKSGYVFDGWYSWDNVVAFDFENTSITWDITLTAKYLRTATIVWDDDSRKIFKYWTIQIWDYVLMDRNLWAKKAWDGITWEDNSPNYGTDNDYYGYYYQWWNNWWFSDKTTSAWATETITVPNEYIPSKYQGSVWNSAQPWSEQNNLWWDDVNTDQARQGPCPDWWHVPSSNEWNALVEVLWDTGSNWTLLAKALKLPPAGYRNYDNLGFHNAGGYGDYWSSSPNNTGSAYYLLFGNNEVNPLNSYRSSFGLPVRCFKNSPVPQTYTLTFDTTTNGWTDATTGSIELQEVDTINLGDYTGTKAWYTFVWWNTNSWAHEKLSENYDNYSISEDTTLYAIFKKTVDIKFNTTWTNEWLTVDRSCEIYNNDLSCSVGSPSIDVEWWLPYWWSISQNSHECDWEINSLKNVSESWVYYAQFYKPDAIFTGYFVSNWAESLTYYSSWCSIPEVWNNETRDESCVIKSPNIEKEWRDAVWFNTESDANNSVLDTQSNLILSSDNNWITYYAITKKDITVTFDDNGNGWTYNPWMCTIWNTENDCPISAPLIHDRSNYTIIWWSDDPLLHSNQWSWWDVKSFTENKTYYAQTSREIRWLFNGNGNTLFWNQTSISESCTKYNWDESCEISVPAIQQNDNTPEILWYSLNSLTGSDIAIINWVLLDGTNISNNTAKIDISWDTSFYAQTIAPRKVYNVSFIKWDEWVATINKEQDACTIEATYNWGVQKTSCDIVLPSGSTNDGYDTFNWWYSDVNWLLLKAGNKKEILSNWTVLKAFSQGEHYSISYYLAEWNWEAGTVVTWTYQSWDSFALPIPVREGYTFDKWTDGLWNAVTEIISSDKGSKTFFANWIKNSYRILYSNVWYDITNLPSSYSYLSATVIPVPDKLRKGYTFAGWRDEAWTIHVAAVTIPKGTMWDKEYTAVWNPITYTISYDLAWWSISSANVNPGSYTVESDDIILKNPTRDHSLFEWWIASGTTAAVKDVIIYNWSVWNRSYVATYSCEDGYEENTEWTKCESKTYTVQYEMNEWVNAGNNPLSIQKWTNGYVISLYNPTKVWYDFAGWTTNINGAVCKSAGWTALDVCLWSTSTANVRVEFEKGQDVIKLTANWTPSKNTPYKVYHERQWIDGEYHKADTTQTDIEDLTWETNVSVIGAIRQYLWFTSPTNQKTAKIEADWSTEIIYEYLRHKNQFTYTPVIGSTTKWKTSLTDYSSESTTRDMYYETPITLEWEANIGYTWSGWDITIWGETTRHNETTYNFNMPLSDVSVTPIVDHNKWTLSFEVNGWTGDADKLTSKYPMYYDDVITYPTVTRIWYTFLGWFDDHNNRYDDNMSLTMPNADLKLTAHWEANDYTLNVEHYLMNLDGENYTEDVASKVVIATKTDATVTEGVSAKDFTGFTLSGASLESVYMDPVEWDAMTIKYYYSRDKHNVTVDEHEGVTLSGTKSWEYYYGSTISVEGKAKEWYTWSWWNVSTGTEEPVFTTDTGVVKILGTWDLVFTPLATINTYHLTVKNDWAIVFSWDVVYKTNISSHLTQPTKNGYTFNGWTNRPANDLMPAKDLVVEAKWTYKSNWWGGGWGGWSSSSTSSEKKTFYNTTWANEQTHGSAELTWDNKNVDFTSKEETTVENEKSIKDMNFEELKDVKADQLNKVDRTKLTKEENEILDAYQWAYEHNVTTMVSLRDANPEGIVTRGHLAKMVVNYATNVLWQKIPEKIPSECRWSDNKKDWESDEIKDFAVKACALWLMWLDMKKFSPNLRVTRAQFGTIMSRLLWWKKYAGWTPYYRKHLNALKANNIMTQIQNPEGRVELRQWVWLMLMRAGEEEK